MLFSLPFVLDQITVPAQGLAVSGVSQGGRRPIPSDPIFSQIVAGTWHAPADGDNVSSRGRDHKWHVVNAGKDGAFDDSGFQGGYLDLTIQSPADQVALLHETGATTIYFNGSPRAGDPYGNGNLYLPVHLKAGPNELLVAGGRGQVHFEFLDASKPVTLQESDTTLPDILTNSKEPLWGAVIVRNAELKPSKGWVIEASLPDGRMERTRIADVLPLSVRKVGFKIPAPAKPVKGKLDVDVAIYRGTEKLDQRQYSLDVKDPLERYKVTFISDVDGSVQYYAAVPAQKPSPSNALVLSLHGASVEATGQAAAYAPKDWATIVAATNRRPYGFDWEDIGRSDALEVLNDAKKRFPHDPARVDLTGHSMGGHGTWAIGTLYPNLFASIAPSAGWISFWSYAGGWNPTANDPAEAILRRSMDVSDTLGRDTNTLNEDVYILHGAADDNVPVEQAREMRKNLEAMHHPHLEYHEQPGAGHWWGNQCVDWPPLFEMIQKARLNPESESLDFTTQNPAVSANLDWLTVQQQQEPLAVSRVVGHRSADRTDYELKTTNVARLQLRELADGATVTLDGQRLSAQDGSTRDFIRLGTSWEVADSGLGGQKSPDRGGPFKQIFAHKLVLVVGTHGTPDETTWGWDRARYDSETLLYRGNGAIDVVADADFSPSRYRGRNVLLYGNATSNSAWASLLKCCPIQVSEGAIQAGGSSIGAGSVGGLIVYPRPGDDKTLVAAVTGNDVKAMRFTDRFGLYTSGVAYPDWIFASTDGKIVADGFFGNKWELAPSLSAGLPAR